MTKKVSSFYAIWVFISIFTTEPLYCVLSWIQFITRQLIYSNPVWNYQFISSYLSPITTLELRTLIYFRTACFGRSIRPSSGRKHNYMNIKMGCRKGNKWTNVFYVPVTVHHNKILCNKTNQMHYFPKFSPTWNSTCFGQFFCPSSGVYSLYTRHWCMSYRFVESFRSWSCSKAVYKPVWRIPVPSVQWINSWWWAEELPETCRFSYRSKFEKLVHLVGFILKELTYFECCVCVDLNSYWWTSTTGWCSLKFVNLYLRLGS
jgi:hypothetical protein